MFTFLSIVLCLIAFIGVICFFGMLLADEDGGMYSAISFVCIAILALCFGCYCMGEENTQQAAVIANSGHYVTQVTDGKVSNVFVWGPAPK
jgi:hypothetical protein